MKYLPFFILNLFSSFAICAQTSYCGFVDKYPIELATYIYSDGDARAVYTYTNFDEPIEINGRLEKSKLVLFEKDSKKKNKATLTFVNFDAAASQLEGTWQDLQSGRQLKINLTKKSDIDLGKNKEWKNKELIQPASLKGKYFKLVISKDKDEFDAKVTSIKIFQKKTDSLLQEIKITCQLWGFESIKRGDFNFDGIEDFSVFEQSYAGPNTSSLYFLFDPKTNSFFESGFTGTSLEFDNKRKRIYERNQCCAGSVVTNAEYKVVNNKMILVEQHCFKWSEKKQQLVERPIKDCQ